MNYHPHIHTIILGGELDERNQWKDKGTKFFFPVKVLSAVFKKHYRQELKILREKGVAFHWDILPWSLYSPQLFSTPTTAKGEHHTLRLLMTSKKIAEVAKQRENTIMVSAPKRCSFSFEKVKTFADCCSPPMQST